MATPTPKPQSSQVRVVLRVRPFLPSEIEAKGANPVPCIKVLDPDRQIGDEVTVHLKDQHTSRSECYKLDSFFGHGDLVGQIFQREVRTVIPGIFQGLNATIFAYGATGSGKTYTMQGTEGEPGMIPLAMSTIFSMCEGTSCGVEISYYEIYMDRCYDLLEIKEKEVMTLDDKDGKLQLKGLSSIAVHSMDEFSQLFSTAIQRRKVAYTGLNDVSSRSHGVLSIFVTNCAIRGKLNLIDLAGNEDNRRTCNEGIRLQESAKINQSLFALSNVIYALNNNESRIPYRESKLTRILQDSLGGTSRALMIACLNPVSYQEAVHTVSLAARSRHIVNYVSAAKNIETPKGKVDMEAKLKAWLESKGKAKSNRRLNGNFSPPFGKTPTSICSSKKSGIVQSSVKIKTTKGRKLFDSVVEYQDGILSSTTSTKVVSRFIEETSLCGVGVNKGNQESFINDSPFIAKNNYYQDRHALKESTDKLQSSEVRDVSLNTICVNQEVTASELPDLPGIPSDKENTKFSSRDFEGSPSLRQMINPQKIFHRQTPRVLSPISSNTPAKHFSPDDGFCLFLEPQTPQTSYATTCGKDEDGTIRTPLDKFNALSSNMKESLAQEYLTFLNVASKEELLQLKGIGQKRAEYIVELRQDSPNPIKSLSDLEKIGLSSRQVHDMFRRMARGIFS